MPIYKIIANIDVEAEISADSGTDVVEEFLDTLEHYWDYIDIRDIRVKEIPVYSHGKTEYRGS